MQLKRRILTESRGKNGDHIMHLPCDTPFTTLCQSESTGGIGAEFGGERDKFYFGYITFEVPPDRNKWPAGSRKCRSGAKERLEIEMLIWNHCDISDD